MAEVVSIRTKNPGAMWPGAISRQFGSTSYENLKDGNKAAIFPTFEQGAAAQFALWAGAGYLGKPLSEAIKKWSGANSYPQYAAALQKAVPGLKLDTVITRSFLAGPQGLAFMKAQAQWEAGKPYPMSDDQWRAAQALAFGTPKPPPDIEPLPKKVDTEGTKHIATGSAGAAVGAAFTLLGMPLWAIVSAAFVVSVVVYLILKKRS